MADDFAGAFRRTTSSLAEFGDRLTKSNVGEALKSVMFNVYAARFVISMLVIVFGIICSVLYVKYTNQSNAKKQQQLQYIVQLWFGPNSQGLLNLLLRIWIYSLCFLVAAPLIFRLLEIWKMAS